MIITNIKKELSYHFNVKLFSLIHNIIQLKQKYHLELKMNIFF
jgi:hypothetical protein